MHLHSAVLDGAYAPGPPAGGLTFRRAAREPTREEMEGIVIRVRDRVTELFKSAGIIVVDEEIEVGSEQEEEPELFDAMLAASIRELVAMSEPLRRVAVLGRETDEWVEPKDKPTCARVKEGYSVHANVRIEGNDREGLAQLCRYITRPPFAMDRIRESGDGRIVVELRRPRMDGGTALLLTEQELMEKLAALVPPPKAHLVRYHGVLAPHARADRGGQATKEETEGTPIRTRRIDPGLQNLDSVGGAIGKDVRGGRAGVSAVRSSDAGGGVHHRASGYWADLAVDGESPADTCGGSRSAQRRRGRSSVGRERRRGRSGRGIESRLSFMGRPAHPRSRRTGRADIEFPGRNRGTPI